jgi:hypothetical protein
MCGIGTINYCIFGIHALIHEYHQQEQHIQETTESTNSSSVVIKGSWFKKGFYKLKTVRNGISFQEHQQSII